MPTTCRFDHPSAHVDADTIRRSQLRQQISSTAANFKNALALRHERGRDASEREVIAACFLNPRVLLFGEVVEERDDRVVLSNIYSSGGKLAHRNTTSDVPS